MNIVKLCIANYENLKVILYVVNGFTKEIDKRFRLEKSAKSTLKREKLIKNINIILDKETEIWKLDQSQTEKNQWNRLHNTFKWKKRLREKIIDVSDY